MTFVLAFLLGPFIYWLFSAWREYQDFLIDEIKDRLFTFLLGISLLSIHLIVLLINGPDWFRVVTIRDSGTITAFLLPGIGYANLCFPSAMENSIFHSVQKLTESAKIVTGLGLIATGYFFIYLHRVDVGL